LGARPSKSPAHASRLSVYHLPPVHFHFPRCGPQVLLGLDAERLLEDANGVLRVLDRVPDRPLVAVDLPIVAALERLVAKEVDVLVLDAGHVLLGLDVLQAVRLVPAGGEDVEGDLAADRIAAVGVSEKHRGKWEGTQYVSP